MVAEPGSLFDRAEYAVPLDPDAPAAVPPALAVGCRVEVLAPSPYRECKGTIRWTDGESVWLDLGYGFELRFSRRLVRAL